MQVQFFEASDEQAKQRLREVASELRSGGIDASLLVSDQQPELLLLVVRGTMGEYPMPNDVRHWRFHELGAGS